MLSSRNLRAASLRIEKPRTSCETGCSLLPLARVDVPGRYQQVRPPSRVENDDPGGMPARTANCTSGWDLAAVQLWNAGGQGDGRPPHGRRCVLRPDARVVSASTALTLQRYLGRRC